MTSRTCCVKGCPVVIEEDGKFFCSRHWWGVPVALRFKIRAEEVGSDAHVALLSEARKFLEARARERRMNA